MKPSSHQVDIRIKNLCRVFRAVQKKGPIERKQIQAYTDLSWGAVSQLSAALVRANVFEQSLHPAGNVGKAPLVLDINKNDNFIIGVDFNFETIRVMVVDLKGCIIKSKVAVVIDASNIVELLLTTLENTIGEFLVEKNILAISLSVQGNVDTLQGVALYLTFVPTWRNLKLKQAVEERFNIPAFVFHDPDCVLIAEKYFGDAFNESYKNVITLNTNYAIGMSLMINSKIYSSSNGRSGEIGHITVVPDGALCSCGKRGCLEEYATKAGIINRFMEAIDNGEATAVDVDDAFRLNYETIREYAHKGDSLCLRLFKNAGRLLGQTCASLSSIFDPDAIILFGELANDRPFYQDIMEQAFCESIYPGATTKLVYSNLGASAVALGAAFFALDNILYSFLTQKAEVSKS